MESAHHPGFVELPTTEASMLIRDQIRKSISADRSHLDRHHASDDEWASSPDNIRLIRQLPQPHDDLFGIAREIPPWWELLRSSPVLAFMVGRCWCFDGLPREGSRERMAAYVRLRRREICGKLGFPSTENTVRLLERFLLSSEQQTPLVIADLKILRQLLRWEPGTYPILGNRGQFGREEIHHLATGRNPSDWPEWISKRQLDFWMGLPACEWFFRLPAPVRFHLAGLYISAAYTQEDKVVMAFLEALPPFRHLRNERKARSYLQSYLQKVEGIVEARTGLLDDTTEWPSPPLESIEGISPIESFEELERESLAMDHCIVSYSDRILLGYYYAYRLETPCRGTIGISLSEAGWAIDQIRGFENEDLSDPELLSRLHAWVSNRSDRRNDTRRFQIWRDLSESCGLPLRKSFVREMLQKA